MTRPPTPSMGFWSSRALRLKWEPRWLITAVPVAKHCNRPKTTDQSSSFISNDIVWSYRRAVTLGDEASAQR